MKKIAAVVLSLVLMFSVSLTAFADLGEPEFKNWYVVCGLNGYNFEDCIPDYENGTSEKVNDFIEPGIKLQVHNYDTSSGEYLLVISDSGHKVKGYGFVNVSENELEKYFIEEKKTVSKENGKKLDNEVKGKVTSDVGIVLRQGPATTFSSYKTIPHNAEISYQYTYTYGGHNWGYTTYKGQSGWTCIDYVKSSPVTATTTTTTSAPVTEQPSVAEENIITDPSNIPDSVTDSDEVFDSLEYYESVQAEMQDNADESEPDGFFSSTKNVIVVCCLGAILLALVAIITVLLIKNKKDSEKGYSSEKWQ